MSNSENFNLHVGSKFFDFMLYDIIYTFIGL